MNIIVLDCCVHYAAGCMCDMYRLSHDGLRIIDCCYIINGHISAYVTHTHTHCLSVCR